jgi:pyrroloquinoline-quinone synthase
MNSSPSATLQSFSAIAQDHPLWSHEFLTRCRDNQLTLPEVQILAVQMYKFSKEFNRILASILSRCPDESAQLVIMDNLFDEMGQGDLNQAHPELFRRFTREIGIADDALAVSPTAPETLNMIATYLDIPHQFGYLPALGAVCFASEGIVSSLYSQLYQGIVGAAPLPKESLIFFEVHIHVDDSHAANLARLIEPRVTTPEQAAEVNRAILRAMDARVQFFDGIQRQVAHLAHSDAARLLLTA